MMTCDRCRKKTLSTTMSYFNTDTICMECDELERSHPGFKEARRIETEAVASGNYNFPGVGLPAELRKEN